MPQYRVYYAREIPDLKTPPATDDMLAFGEHVLALGSFHTLMSAGDGAEDVPADIFYQTTFFDGRRVLE